MKPLFAFIAIILTHTAIATPDYSQWIQGEWTNDRITTGRGSRFCISFEKNTCSNLFTYKDYVPYTVKGNILEISNIIYGKKTVTCRYTIAQLTDSVLILYRATNTDLMPDTLQLSRIQPVNDIVPEKIFFYSSLCFGTCASMYLRVDSARHLLFYGARYTTLQGGYSGTITRDDYKMILRLISELPVNTIKPQYQANWTDDQTCNVAIDYNGKTLFSSVYGFDEEPAALRLLLHKLAAVYKKANLKKDATVTANSFPGIGKQSDR